MSRVRGLDRLGRTAITEATPGSGATLPVRLAKSQDAVLHLASGEAYDFEFEPQAAGEIPLQVENNLNQAKLVGKIVVE